VIVMAERPVFVKIDEHKDVHAVIGAIKGKIAEAKDALNNINRIKQQEEKELDAWKSEIEEVEKKVSFIDEALS